MTRKQPAFDLGTVSLDDAETVLVPRPLVEEMSQAIAAMHTLAAEGMLGVAKGLGLLARRQRKGPAPVCADCRRNVAVGLTHEADCTSPEAAHYRTTEVPGLQL